MAVRQPETFPELVAFYRETFLPLYDRFQSQESVPQELNAEIAAALDHLLCSVVDPSANPFPPDAIRAAAGHLKRATFDGFKVVFDQEVRRPREEFSNGRYADVHDGRFRHEVAEQWEKAKKDFLEARAFERKTRTPDLEIWDAAFEKWKAVLPHAERFAAFAADPAVIRAKRMSARQKVLAVVKWAITLLLGALLAKAI